MQEQHDDRPNIIWIFGDQHRAQALSCNGDPNVSTPNLDRLAAMGANLTGAVAGFPLCCPYRGSLLTSRYPHKCVPGHQYQMPPGQPTIATVFNEAGYHTAYIGKWHLDGCREEFSSVARHIVPPERRGDFQHWIAYENNNTQWYCWVHGGEGENAFQYRLPGYETDELSNLLIEYVQKRAADQNKQPFFAALSVQPPHDPYVAPEEFMGRHRPANVELRPNVPVVKEIREQAQRDLAGHYAQIENLDWNVGRIIKALDDCQLLFNTHIIFFSDHGDMHGSHGQFRKTTAYEEAVRIPFIISGEQPHPYHREGRRSGRFNVLLNHVDVAPTTLGLCGIDIPDWMEGTDYSSYRLAHRPKVEEPDSAYLQSVIPTGHADSADKPWRGIITSDDWKYVCFEGVAWLMFNLNNDPYEQVNLAHNSKYRQIRKRLNDRLAQWITDTDDNFTLPEE